MLKMCKHRKITRKYIKLLKMLPPEGKIVRKKFFCAFLYVPDFLQ